MSILKKQKINEAGHTMLELIAALAVMGVLSLGSLWGYQQAVVRNRSNIIMEAVSKRAIVASNTKTTYGEASLKEFEDDEFTKGYDVSITETGDGFFYITLKGVSDGVVDYIRTIRWPEPYNILVKNHGDAGEGVAIEAFDITSGGDSNDISFVYHERLDSSIRRGYPTESVCIEKGGAWVSGRCDCRGAYMTSTGCEVVSEGEEHPSSSLCYRDDDCPNYAHACRNGKCVPDPDCDGTTEFCYENSIARCAKQGLRSGAHQTLNPDILRSCDTDQTCVEYGKRATCVTLPEPEPDPDPNL